MNFDGSRPTRRPPREVTPSSLRAAALRYLQRYAPTTYAFRRVMKRKIDASLGFHGGDPDELARMLDDLVERLTEAGALDDVRWATSRAEELHRHGVPLRGIRAKMTQKGIDSETATLALDALQETLSEHGDPDLLAAWAYARRRRLGPFRSDPEQRSDRREKDLAAMGRVGFPWGLARRVVDGSLGDEEELLQSGIP